MIPENCQENRLTRLNIIIRKEHWTREKVWEKRRAEQSWVKFVITTDVQALFKVWKKEMNTFPIYFIWYKRRFYKDIITFKKINIDHVASNFG